MEYITFDDLKKIDIKMGKIVSAEALPDSNKLLKLMVDFGESEPRQILSGIAKQYAPEQLVGKLCPFVVNLPPKKLGEWESFGMILCADGDGPVLLHPDRDLSPGSLVK